MRTQVMYIALGLEAVGLAAPKCSAVVFGSDSFNYSNGPLAPNNGGIGWALGGGSATSWGPASGIAPQVNNGSVLTAGGSIPRAYGGNGNSSAIQATGALYFGVNLSFVSGLDASSTGSAVLSSLDFGTERIQFGRPAGLSDYDIDNLGGNNIADTGIDTATHPAVRLVGSVQWDVGGGDGVLKLWVNPTAFDFDTVLGVDSGIDTSATAVMDYGNTSNWSNAVQLSSASNAAVNWSRLVVASTFAEAAAISGSATWTKSTNGNWEDSTNWSNNIVPDSVGATATFANSIGPSPATVTLTVNETIGNLTFSNTSGGNFTIAATNGSRLTFNNSATGSTITAAAGSANQTISAPIALADELTASILGTGVTLSGGISGAAGLKKAGSGRLVLGGNNTYTGSTIVGGGVLELGPNGNLPSGTNVTIDSTASPAVIQIDARNASGLQTVTLGNLNLISGGTLTAVSGPNPSTTGHVNRMLLVASSLSNNGAIDLGGNDLLIHNGDLHAIWNQAAAGFDRSAGYWNGMGDGTLRSSAAALDTTFLVTLGVANGLQNFDGLTVFPTDVLVKYTYYGDTNLDGVVNGADYQQIDLGFGGNLSGWSDGDFNYDGVVNGSDFALIDNTFNQLTATGSIPLAILAGSSNLIASAAMVSPVPEPTTLGLFGIAAVGLIGQRKRKVR